VKLHGDTAGPQGVGVLGANRIGMAQTTEELTREGFERTVLEVALIDVIVRFEKSHFAPKATTANVLRKLSVVVLQMARAEEAQTQYPD
jgi:hypothetical protein